ncbi:Poly [ADP-ribose] polymerase 2 [Bienertia sinuspersici]
MENRYLRPYRSEEFQEEDVWGVIKETSEVDVRNSPTIRRSISRRLPTASRMIPGVQTHQQTDDSDSKLMQNSAPVNVPDWSKIYGKSPKKNNNNGNVSSSFNRNHNDNDYCARSEDDDEGNGNGDGDDDDDDDDEDRLPPHEWLAKRLARNQISSFSVCEGVGRTLKGRDLSRVRNAVLSKTGFL